MMEDIGYIKGCRICTNINDEMICDTSDLEITLKRLKYLQENSVMQRIYKTVKDVI